MGTIIVESNNLLAVLSSAWTLKHRNLLLIIGILIGKLINYSDRWPKLLKCGWSAFQDVRVSKNTPNWRPEVFGIVLEKPVWWKRFWNHPTNNNWFKLHTLILYCCTKIFHFTFSHPLIAIFTFNYSLLSF